MAMVRFQSFKQVVSNLLLPPRMNMFLDIHEDMDESVFGQFIV